MKLHNSILIRMCLAAAVVLSLAMPAKSIGNLQLNSSGPVGPNDQDFVVKFKGEIISWKNLTDLLRQHNITIPQEDKVLAEVLRQKDSSAQSCQGRCFMDERSEEKRCYCDIACKTFGDCCLDFHSRCNLSGNANDSNLLPNAKCEETNPFSWSGVIMQSSCSLLGDQDRNECQTVQQLNMTIQKELPVYDWTQNLTYRSIACARCNGKENVTFWGLNMECTGGWWVGGDINAVKTFVKDNSCTWKYAPLLERKQRYKSCVHHDTQCTASNQLPVMSVIKELCSSYSMTFRVDATTIVKYRNPHCVLCNPEGKRQPGSPASGPPMPPWSILLDVSSNVSYPKEPETPQPTVITGHSTQGPNDQDFVVQSKGEIISWKNLTDLLRQHNITIPQENEVLAEVLQQKDSSAQSCQGRCFMDERGDEKRCYCDIACKTFGDCCLDFHSRCNLHGNANDGDLLPNAKCGETNPFSWSGAIMQSSCSLLGDQGINECSTVQQLNMTIQNELPVYDWTQNLTYRSTACARCNGEGNLTFWGLNIECMGGSWDGGDINTVKTFVKDNSCTWKYAPLPELKQRSKSCVHHDTQCTASNQLPVMSVIKELCFSYAMTFRVYATTIVKYRNPHCVLCNPEGKRQPGSSAGGPPTPPWSILLDVSSNIAYPKEPKNPQSNITTGPSAQGDKDPKEDSSVLIYITLICTVLSIISLCCLLGVYLMFKELRNLPGKCLINLSLALLCYQTIFLIAVKSKEIDVVCKAVAIFLHFFILAAFSWMCAMAFDTANAFSVKGGNTRRQPSNIKKTFIKYCTVGWGLPAAIVALCSALDSSGTLHFGYGNGTYCWISDKIGMIVSMVTPISLALVFNILCLTKNIYAIRRLQEGASLATSNSSQASLTLICIKLSTVMGLTWILGLLANWNQTAFLEYPSAVLNSMQGFFIALCFTTTKKVRGLLKEGLSKPLWNVTADSHTSVTRDKYTGNADVKPAAGSMNMNCLSGDKTKQYTL